MRVVALVPLPGFDVFNFAARLGGFLPDVVATGEGAGVVGDAVELVNRVSFAFVI